MNIKQASNKVAQIGLLYELSHQLECYFISRFVDFLNNVASVGTQKFNHVLKNLHLLILFLDI